MPANTAANPRKWAYWIAAAILIAATIGGLVGLGNLNDTTLPAPDDDKEVREQNLPKVSLSVVKKQRLVEWVMAEGIVQTVRRAQLFFEVPGRVQAIGVDAEGAALKEGSSVTGPGQGLPNGLLLARLDDRQALAQVAQARAAVSIAREQVRESEAVLAARRIDLDAGARELDRANALKQRGIVSYADQAEKQRSVDQAGSALKEALSRLAASKAALTQSRSELKTTELQLEKTQLRAPFDGQVARLNLKEGQFVSGTNALGTDSQAEEQAAIIITDHNNWEVALHLPPAAAISVSPGQRAYASYSANALLEAERTGFKRGAFAVGEVWSVSPSISRIKRSVLVRLRFSGRHRIFSDGLYVTAWIAARELHDVPAVSYDALLSRGNQTTVFVYDETTRSVQRRSLGIDLFGLHEVAIASGLKTGERVVTRGQHLLVEGDRVAIVPNSMAAVSKAAR